MAATKKQGSDLFLFWAGVTVLCAGIAYFAEGFGKLVFLIGLAGTAIALYGFLKIKPGEGKSAGVPGNAALKLLGLVIAWGGWLITVSGIHITTNLGGRLIFALVGIVVSLVGVLGVLPVAFGKSAIGKAQSVTYSAVKTSMEHSR